MGLGVVMPGGVTTRAGALLLSCDDGTSVEVPPERTGEAWQLLRGSPHPPFPWGCSFLQTTRERVDLVARELGLQTTQGEAVDP